LGLRYLSEEIEEIQTLAEQGYTNKQIADKLGRTPAAIRNYRHRNKIKTKTQNSIQTLKENEKTLNKNVKRLQSQIKILQTRHREVSNALQLDKTTLNNRLEKALYTMKNQKPELFKITTEQQLGKLAGELTGTFLKWLIS